jgi:hypothetical protein
VSTPTVDFVPLACVNRLQRSPAAHRLVSGRRTEDHAGTAAPAPTGGQRLDYGLGTVEFSPMTAAMPAGAWMNQNWQNGQDWVPTAKRHIPLGPVPGRPRCGGPLHLRPQPDRPRLCLADPLEHAGGAERRQQHRQLGIRTATPSPSPAIPPASRFTPMAMGVKASTTATFGSTGFGTVDTGFGLGGDLGSSLGLGGVDTSGGPAAGIGGDDGSGCRRDDLAGRRWLTRET